MRTSIIAAALAVSLGGSVSATELLVANIMTTPATWSVQDNEYVAAKPLMTVPAGAHGIKSFQAGRVVVKLVDGAGRSASQTVVFDPAKVASSGGRTFWCLASRSGADGAPQILVLDQATCQQFLVNQPPR